MHRRDLLGAAALATAGSVAAVARDRPDVSTPRRPAAPLGTLDVPGGRDFVTDEDAGLAYVAATDRLVVVDVSDPASPAVLAERREILADHAKGPLTAMPDAKLHGDRLIVCGQQWENAEEGAAVVVFDVSDPADPTRVAVHETGFPVHNAAFDGTVAYLTGSLLERWPVVVVRFEGGESTELARWSVIDADERWADLKPGVRRVHDVHLDGDRLYVFNWDAGVRVLDVSDPAALTQRAVLGSRDPDAILESEHYTPGKQFGPALWELPGNATAGRTNGDGTLLAVGKEALDWRETARSGGPGPIEIWDVSDLSAATKVVVLTPPDLDPEGVGNSKNCAWRGDRLYAAWRGSGTRVYDLSTPTEPMVLGGYDRMDAHTARTLAEGYAALQNPGPNDGREKPGRLYTFAEPSDEDARPAPTGSPLDIEPTTTTSRRTGTADWTTTSPSTSTGTSPSDAATDAGTTRRDSTTDPSDTTGTASTPGFSAVAGVGGALLALLAGRRLRESD